KDGAMIMHRAYWKAIRRRKPEKTSASPAGEAEILKLNERGAKCASDWRRSGRSQSGQFGRVRLGGHFGQRRSSRSALRRIDVRRGRRRSEFAGAHNLFHLLAIERFKLEQ